MNHPSALTSLSIACVSALSFLGLTAHAKDLHGSRPNIILVMTDDQGMGDLSCMGNTVLKTPHLDRFYEQSTRFTDFQVSPTCAPTRAALMSGRPPFKVGVTHTILQRERMALDIVTLPQALKTAGYTTGIFGKWHLGDEDPYLPSNRGFDESLIHGAGGIGQVGLGDFPPNGTNSYFDSILLHNNNIVQTEGYCTDLFFHAGLAWINEKRTAPTKAPYFAYISLNAPHAPMIAPKSFTKRFTDLGYGKKTAGRYGMIENIDHNMGQLMAKLNEWNALDNTLVIFMTDNGATNLTGKLNGEKVKMFNYNMKGAKNSPHEGGSHVPAFWYWKDTLDQGIDIPALTAHLDLFPTFLDLAGASPEKRPDTMQPLDGRSLLPLLHNATAPWADRELFFHCGRWNPGKRTEAKFEKCAVRTQRWRFVNNTELYDISTDPGQTKNIADTYPDIITQLRKSYDQWWESALPLMVNEGLSKLKNHPLHLRYEAQEKGEGIPNWKPADL